MKALFLWILNLLLVLPGWTLHIHLHQFLEDNNYKHVNFIHSKNTSFHLDIQDFFNKNSSTRFVEFAQFQTQNHSEMDFNVILFDWSSNDLLEVLHSISSTHKKTSMLYLKKSQVGEFQIREKLNQIQRNSLFYLVHEDLQGQLNWFYVVTLNNLSRGVMNQLQFQPNSLQIKEDYNLQEIPIRSISLSWTPYLTFTNCSQGRLGCESYGYLVDLCNILAKQFNFTMISNKDPNHDWGVFPKSGRYDLTGNWSGVMGDVVRGKYDMSISGWTMTPKRFKILDFSVFASNYEILMVKKSLNQLDSGLFVRPVNRQTWMALGGMVLLMGALYFLPFFFWKSYTESTSFKIVFISSWYFFVLFNAYYSGVLTMFFTTEFQIKFENARDVLQAYPDWQLITNKGSEVHFRIEDPLFRQFWNRAWNSTPYLSQQHLYKNPQEAFQRINDESTIVHMQLSQARGFLKKNPFYKDDINQFGLRAKGYYGLIFTKNSPLQSIFDLGVARLRESGTLEQLSLTWEGTLETSKPGLDFSYLTLPQMGLVFMVLIGCGVLSLFILGLEILFKKRPLITIFHIFY